MRRYVSAWLACSATNVVLGVFFHRFVMGEQIRAFFQQLGSQPRPDLALGTHLVATTVMVYLYPRFCKGRAAALEGYRLGVAVGILIIAPIAFVFLVMRISMWTIAADVLWHTVIEEPFSGVAAALVYQRFLGDRVSR